MRTKKDSVILIAAMAGCLAGCVTIMTAKVPKKTAVQNETAAGTVETEETSSAAKHTAGLTPDHRESPELDMFLEYMKNIDGNFVLSPYSTKDCFSILYPAADGVTKAELDSVFGFDETPVEYYKDNDAQQKFNGGKGVSIVNKAYISRDMKDILNKDALSTDNIEFVQMEKSVPKINIYIEKQTSGKITDFLEDGSLDDVQTFLLNTIYFNKSWDYNDNTVAWNGGESVKSFSGHVSTHSCKEATDNIDVLRLRYDEEKGDTHQYSFYVICQNSEKENDRDAVENYLKGITDEKFEDLLDFEDYDGLKGYSDVVFNVASFKDQTKGSMKETLKDLGITTAFTDDADFHRFGPLKIDDVLQECYIDVGSKGTEAAAATGIMMKNATAARPSDIQKIKHVVTDSDFAYVVKDDTSSAVLFMGMVRNLEA